MRDVVDVRLTLLGPVHVLLDGRPVDVGGPRQRAVLAILAIAGGEMVPVARLIEGLWPHTAPADPGASLQTFVSRLRRRLEPTASARTRSQLLTGGAHGYALRLGPDDVDVWRFERLVAEGSALVDTDPGTAVARLTEALGLWSGPALAEYADDAWAAPEIARLNELRAVARERLAAARLSRGDAAVLVGDLEALVAEAPLREERWRLLVLALYRAQRQADALSALRRARAMLSEELGVDPGPALRAVEKQVLAQSPALEPVVPDPPAPTAPERPLPLGDPLVERQRELAQLDACIEQAGAGAGSLAVVEGPAGIGKSRLLTEIRRRAAERNVRVLYARASQLEQEFSFGVVRQLFEPLIVDPDRRSQLLRGAAQTAVPVFDLASPTGTGDDSAFAMLHGLYWLTVNLVADGPTVLVIDDIHWSDTGSLRFLAYLARRLEGLSAAMVVAYRTGEQHVLGGLIDELRQDVSTVGVRPVPLTRGAVAEMISSRLGEQPDEEFVAACFDGTTGNPLLVRQLLRALEGDGIRPDRAHADIARMFGSRAVSSMVLLRLRRLPAPATAVARSLSVLGDGTGLPEVARLAGIREAEAAEVTALLVKAEIVRPEPPVAFVHPLVRDAVYGDVAPGERELLHESAARILEESGRSDEQVAAQLLQAPRRGNPWVVEVLRRAAKDAVRRGSSDGAVTFLSRALAEPAAADLRPEVQLELGLVETSTNGPAAHRDLQAAYDSLADDDARAVAALALTRTLVFVGDFGSPVRFAEQALAQLPERLVEPRAAVLAYERIAGQMHGVDPEVWRFAREPPIPGEGSGSRMLQATVAYERMCRAAPRADAVALAAASLGDGQLVSDDPGLLWVWSQVVLDLADEDVLPNWDAINAAAHQRGSLFSVLAVGFWRAWSLMRRGELAEAEHSIRTGLEQLDMWQRNATTQPYGRATLARILVDQDRLDEARVIAGPPDEPLSAIDGDRLLAEVRAEMLLAD
ncbi:MAG: regulator, partial [Frankiales bacterium]|nr:regulator [Frankiales bacterium]